MHSSLIILSTVISIISAGDSADRDYSYSISGGNEGECTFTGTISKHRYGGALCEEETITRTDFKQNGDLTWEILTKACPQLVYAGCADPDWEVRDHSMDDLLWLSCTQCPVCACPKDAADTYYTRHTTQFSLTSFEKKTCYGCSCIAFPKYVDGNWTNLYGRYCTVNHTFSGIDGLKDVQCPYVDTYTPAPIAGSGCDDGANHIYVPGQSFFYYDSNDPICETYCICNDDNVATCETGWYDIFHNDLLKYPFLESCGASLSDAWDQTSRYVTPGNCLPGEMDASSRCPSANCGNKGGTWEGIQWTSGEYREDGTFRWAMYDCVDCQCVNNAPVCTVYDSGERSQEDCTRDALVCSFDENDDGVIGDIADDTKCDVSAGEKYCGWKQIQLYNNYDPDVVCIEDSVELDAYWGCFEDILCDGLFGYKALEDGEGRCSYDKVSFTAYAYDCMDYKWLTEEYTLEVNAMCCTNTDCGIHGCTCNDQEISATALGDDNKCGANSKMSQYLKHVYECSFGARGISNNDFIKAIKCGVALSSEKYGVCDIIGAYWKDATRCDCGRYQVLEKMYRNEDYYNDLRADLQLKFDEKYEDTQLKLSAWNQAYSCGQEFKCDIWGKGSIDGVYHWCVWCLSLVVIVFVTFFM